MSFYSPIDRLAAESDRPKGTGAEFMTELSKKPGYKQAEVDDRDLQTLMALPKMAKEEFIATLANKPARIPKAQELESTYHEDYTMPGGTNYREILLQDPSLNYGGKREHFGGAPNVLASIRAKDRIGPNKERILHLEEIQSDLHQEGRKKGYQPKGVDLFGEVRKAKAEHAELSRQLALAKTMSAQAEAGLTSNRPLYQDPNVQARLRKTQEASNRAVMDLMPQVMKADEAHRKLYATATQSVPDAPYKKNWHELALKRMIYHAAKQGYDEIHLTPGEEQARRYGLADDEAKGMTGFYDNMLPSFLNKFGKKYNVQVGQAPFMHKQDPKQAAEDDALLAELGAPPAKGKVVNLHSFRMTPEMRADVLKNGMPLYAEGGSMSVSRETAKPVARGIIKEQITVSPSQDVMRYELMGIKRSSKKVK